MYELWYGYIKPKFKNNANLKLIFFYKDIPDDI